MLPNEFDMVGPAMKGYRHVETAKKLDIELDEGASQTSRRAFLEDEPNNESMNVRWITRTLYQDTAMYYWRHPCPSSLLAPPLTGYRTKAGATPSNLPRCQPKARPPIPSYTRVVKSFEWSAALTPRALSRTMREAHATASSSLTGTLAYKKAFCCLEISASSRGCRILERTSIGM